MSLEQALNETTNAINNLIAVLTKSDMAIPISEQKQVDKAEHPKPLKVKQKDQETKPETEPTWTTCDVKTPPIEDVVRALLTLSKKDRDSAVAILTRFKAKHAREVPEEVRAEFLHAVREKIAVLEDLKDVKF